MYRYKKKDEMDYNNCRYPYPNVKMDKMNAKLARTTVFHASNNVSEERMPRNPESKYWTCNRETTRC